MPWGQIHTNRILPYSEITLECLEDKLGILSKGYVWGICPRDTVLDIFPELLAQIDLISPISFNLLESARKGIKAPYTIRNAPKHSKMFKLFDIALNYSQLLDFAADCN